MEWQKKVREMLALLLVAGDLCLLLIVEVVAVVVTEKHLEAADDLIPLRVEIVIAIIL